MPANVVFSYNSSYPRGYIMQIYSVDHKFSQEETLEEYEKAGGTIETWNRRYAMWTITDRMVEELQYLLDPYLIFATNPPEPDGRKYSFIQPEEGTPQYESIKYTGKYTSTFNEGKHLILERV